jgi:hypothetical protein
MKRDHIRFLLCNLISAVAFIFLPPAPYALAEESKDKKDIVALRTGAEIGIAEDQDEQMFAQADVNPSITHYLTADQKCEKVDSLIREDTSIGFNILPLKVPHHQAFGELDLGD